jgi:hypothetical protein
LLLLAAVAWFKAIFVGWSAFFPNAGDHPFAAFLGFIFGAACGWVAVVSTDIHISKASIKS